MSTLERGHNAVLPSAWHRDYTRSMLTHRQGNLDVLSRHSLATWLWALAFAGLALFVFAWAVRSWLVLTFPFQVEYGEGPVADWVRTIAHGHLPYKPIQPEPWTFSVYTPLYLLASSALMALGLPLWVGGRLLSLVSALGLAALLFGLARDQRSPGDRMGALAAVGLFLASPYLTRWATFYRPDMLALFWSALGIAFISHGQVYRRSGMVVPALCFVAAFMTKQSFVAAPLAALLFLGQTSWRQAQRLLLSLAVAGAMALGALALAVGPGTLWADLITGNSNPFSAASLPRFETSFVRIAGVVVALGLLALFWPQPASANATPSSDRTLLGLYALFGLLATVSVGKAGAWENYFLEPFFILCVLAGRTLGRLATGRRAARMAAPLLIGLQLLLFLPGFERFGPGAEQRWLATLDAERTALLAAMASTPAGQPLLSEDLGLLATAGRPVFLHTFVYTQLTRQGDFDQTPLLRAIAMRRFPLVIERRGALEDRLDLDRWTPEVLSAIERSYAIEGTAGQWLLLRPAPALRPLDLPLNPHLRLRGWAVEVNRRPTPSGPMAVRPGDRLRIHLLWERTACPECIPAGDEQTFVHLLDWQGERLAQSDTPPRQGSAVLTSRRPALIRDTHDLTVPVTAEPGALALLAGAYRLTAIGIEPLGPPQRLSGLKIALTPESEAGPTANAAPALGPLALESVSSLPAGVQPGQTLTLTARWLAWEPPERDLTTFLHLLPQSAAGPPVAQQDQRPLAGRYPTDVWSAGERVTVTYTVTLPGSLSAGHYGVRLGWYDPATGERLVGPAGDTISVGTLEIGDERLERESWRHAAGG
ncbi:MAG: hypothetical protein M5U01_29875 [Ardenticatenaceae bacterium]|nr:hypothetical protein [Ardenticatenaceae bacterium]